MKLFKLFYESEMKLKNLFSPAMFINLFGVFRPSHRSLCQHSSLFE